MDEINKVLDKMPEVIRVKNDDEIVDCRLAFFYHKDRRHNWTASYYCAEYDYFLSCGYGGTITEAIKHLKRTIQDIKVKNCSGQYDYIL